MAANKQVPQAVTDLKAKYAQLGLGDLDRFTTGTGARTKFDEAKAQNAVVSEVYKLNPAAYTTKGKLNFDAATAKYQYEQPKLSFTQATGFAGAINAFNTAVGRVRELGIENINKADRETIRRYAEQVRDYDSDSLSATAKQAIKNISDAELAIDAVANQTELVRVQQLRSNNLDKDGVTSLRLSRKEREAARNRYQTEQDALSRLVSTGNQAIPGMAESLRRIGVTDVVAGTGSQDARIGQVDTRLSGLGAEQMFGKSSLVGKLNSQITDDQIRTDLANTRRTQAQGVYNLANEALVDLNSRLEQATAFRSTLPAGDVRLKATDDVIARLRTDISDVTADLNSARSIYENPGDIGADTVTSFRETLRLPEERALDQIRTIDPDLLDTARGISRQYQEMAATPTGATTDPRTEQLRGRWRTRR